MKKKPKLSVGDGTPDDGEPNHQFGDRANAPTTEENEIARENLKSSNYRNGVPVLPVFRSGSTHDSIGPDNYVRNRKD